MKRKHIIASNTVWDISVGEERSIYDATGQKSLLPGPDSVILDSKIAQALHDLGKACDLITPSEAALPMFKISMLFEEMPDELHNIAQVANPDDEELCIYGIDAEFVTDNHDTVACELHFHFGTHYGGGYEDIGTALFTADKGSNCFHIVPWSLYDLSGQQLYDHKSLTGIYAWLGWLWNGIQYRLINRPEFVHLRHKRFPQNEILEAKKRPVKNTQVVKVQRLITIALDDDESLPAATNHNKHEITLTLWGVAGHWRICRSGKRIWIKPYLKGKDRFNNKVMYSSKDYKFLTESEEVHG